MTAGWNTELRTKRARGGMTAALAPATRLLARLVAAPRLAATPGVATVLAAEIRGRSIDDGEGSALELGLVLSRTL